MKRVNHPLLLLLLLLPAIAAGAETVPSSLLARFFEDKLTHPYVMVRIEGIGGLGRLGESEAVAELADLAERTSGFERLLALWALARIGTPEALEKAAPEGEQALRPGGTFHELAARTALVAALKPGEASGIFDPVLPELYTKARRGRTEEKLLAAWALYEIGAPVTAATADEAMRAVAEGLDLGHGNYTRHLNYLRLAGPRAGGIVAPKLESLFLSHPFELGLIPRKALTAFTLAFIAYPQDSPVLPDFRSELERDLDRSLYDFTALKDIRTLGPFACTAGMIEKLREKADRERDEEERELAEENLRMCGG